MAGTNTPRQPCEVYMIQVASDHLPGMVVVVTGELMRYAKFGQDLNRLKAPIGSDIVWAAGPSVKRNVDRGLTRVLQEPTAQWAWLIGDDHSFAPDVILRLLDRRVPCVAPIVTDRAPPFATTLVRRGKNVPLDNLPSTGLYNLVDDETYGDAGLLLWREVISATGPPWQDHPGTGVMNVEDRIFADRIKAAGFDLHLDMDVAMGHITPCEVLPQRRDGKWKAMLRFRGKVLHDTA